MWKSERANLKKFGDAKLEGLRLRVWEVANRAGIGEELDKLFLVPMANFS
jgi:hypothetical protein